MEILSSLIAAKPASEERKCNIYPISNLLCSFFSIRHPTSKMKIAPEGNENGTRMKRMQLINADSEIRLIHIRSNPFYPLNPCSIRNPTSDIRNVFISAIRHPISDMFFLPPSEMTIAPKGNENGTRMKRINTDL